jgi:hypothetical protein
MKYFKGGKKTSFQEAEMVGTLSSICLFGAAFFFGIAATIKILTWIIVRNSEYAGGESCIGNLISTCAALAGIYLIYLSIRGF